jgi:lipid A 3-O-deacylase
MRRMLIPFLSALVCIHGILLLPADSHAGPMNSAFSLRWENDTFGGTDANYTNGMSLALTRTGKGLLGGVWDLGGVASGRKSIVYELTQFQFTPSNLTVSSPDPNDRPYAGMTYLACITHLQKEESLQSLKLIAGFVGPDSGAEEAQKVAHHLLNESTPQGWSAQLRDEPVVNLLYEYRHRYRLPSRNGPFGVELIPMGGAFLGNYLIQAHSEILFRFGYRLPDDFGATSLRGIGYLPLPQLENEDHSWGINAYIRGGANLVFHNLTLDGNSFISSRSVEKRLVVPAVEFGTALWTRKFLTTLSFQYWGREFDSQPLREGYGSILFSFPF